MERARPTSETWEETAETAGQLVELPGGSMPTGWKTSIESGAKMAYEARKHDKAAAGSHKRKWKQLHQAAKATYRERDRG